ncbi:hypothetical protein [Nocardia wallacei]|uniref:hypothetical protein n=1 Tax=Nocardia wallacei TaxID=480035 RepID=UPI002454D6E9|nr:hypothetical protein [Nocardia wallacei]
MRRLGGMVDSESVRLYQGVVYAGFLISAVQSIWLGTPPTAVAQAMGDFVESMWLALLIVCPLLAALGYWRRTRPGGLWLLAASDAASACTTGAYVAAVLQATWAERASFAAWVVFMLSVCSVLILWRDVRRIREMSRLVKEAKRE